MNHRFYDKAKEVDRLAQAYSPENLAAIERLFKVKGIEHYFFRERILAVPSLMTWLLPLAERGYFSGENNPRPREVENQPGAFMIPMWNVLPYLEKVAEQDQKNRDRAITESLVTIVDGITGYRDAEGQRIDNYRTDWFMVKVLAKLPAETWTDRHIEFIGEALNARFGSGVDSEIGKKVLPTLIEGKRTDLIQKLLSVMFAFRRERRALGEKVDGVMKEFWLKEALSAENRERIAALCGLEALDIVLAKMREIASIDEGAIFTVWVPSIEPSAQTTFPDKYVNQLVSLARDILEHRSASEVRMRVAELLAEEYAILRRLAVHAINHHYDELQDVFWNWQGNPLKDTELHHELYALLERHCRTFTDPQVIQLLAWIEGVGCEGPSEPRNELRDAWKRKRWLTALKDNEDHRVKELFDRYDQKASGDVDHPAFLVWSESGFVRHLSPKPVPELSSMSNSEIAIFLNQWEEQDRSGLEAVTSQGLSAALKQCVLEDPEKFASDMSPFLDIPETYQHDLLHGLKEAWASQKDFSVGEVILFIERLIGSNSFWDKEYEDHEENYRNWLVREIAEFVEAGVQDDKHAFDAQQLPEIEKILLDLMDKAKSVVSEASRIVDSVLTSPRACVFSSAVNYALRYGRLYGKAKKIKWPDAIRREFNDRLDPTTEPAIDFWVTLGRFIPNFVFLDREWVFGEIDRIFPRDSERHWVASFGAYLSHSYNVYEEIYSELKSRGHYRKALEVDFGDRYVTERLVQHICIAFLEDWEKVADADSLMHRILELAKVAQLSEVIGFLGRLEGEEPRGKLKQRVKTLWRAMFDLLRVRQKESEYQAVISELYLWLSFTDRIDDEIKEWTLLTAKHIRAQYRESGLVEQLAKHVDHNPAEVAGIYIEMLNAGTYPNYDVENVRKIIGSLYRQGAKEQADMICNMYGEVGDYSLRPLYEEHNQGVGRRE